MRVFILSVLTTVIFAGATAFVLNSYYQQQVDQAYATTGARVSTN